MIFGGGGFGFPMSGDIRRAGFCLQMRDDIQCGGFGFPMRADFGVRLGSTVSEVYYPKIKGRAFILCRLIGVFHKI